MAKAKFDRSKPHVNIGTTGHVDHGKTTLTAAIINCLATEKVEHREESVDDIDNAPEEKERGITIAISHQEYETQGAPLRARRLPRPRRLHQEHDHRRRADGRRDSGRVGDRRPMPQTREHILLMRQVGVPYIVVFLNKVDMVDDRRAARTGRARSARTALEVRVPRRRHPGHPRLGAQGASIGRQARRPGCRSDLRADGRGRRVHSDAGARRRQAVPDAGRRRLHDHRPRHGRYGPRRARSGQGRRGSRDRRPHRRDAQVGRYRHRDVPQAARHRHRRRQHRRAAARHRAQRDRARSGAGEARLDQAAHEVQSRGLRPLEGRGRPPHAVLRELPSRSSISARPT